MNSAALHKMLKENLRSSVGEERTHFQSHGYDYIHGSKNDQSNNDPVTLHLLNDILGSRGRLLCAACVFLSTLCVYGVVNPTSLHISSSC